MRVTCRGGLIINNLRPAIIALLALAVLTAGVVAFQASPQASGNPGGKMYWTQTNDGKIRRSNLDGSGAEDVVIAGLALPNAIALDVAGGKLYWTNSGKEKIQRSNLDGSEVEDLITGFAGLTPHDIALDVAAGKMYWSVFHTFFGNGKIQRANLDGSGVEDIVKGLEEPRGIALDVAGGKIYWADLVTGKIQRANLDGSGAEDLVKAARPTRMALDTAGGKMYWTVHLGLVAVRRANLDGTDPELVANLDFDTVAEGIALDLAAGKIYWAEAFFGTIHRSNLDGSGLRVVVSGLGNPGGIALDIATAPTPTPTPIPPGECLDLNDDGKVNGRDVRIVARALNTQNPAGDVNNDGNVDLSDLFLVLGSLLDRDCR